MYVYVRERLHMKVHRSFFHGSILFHQSSVVVDNYSTSAEAKAPLRA
jgi:hypothetical protein